MRVVGEGKGSFIVAKRRERRDARSGGLNRKQQRTGNEFTRQISGARLGDALQVVAVLPIQHHISLPFTMI